MSTTHPHNIELAAAARPDIAYSAWQAFALAALIRDTLEHHGGDEAGGLALKGDVQDATMLSLDSLVTLLRSIATAAE